MGLFDSLKKKAPELKDKAAGLAASQNDKIDQGIDKVAGLAGKVTKGKYDDKIDGVASKAKESIDKFGESDKPGDQPR
jgi:hypothetical protein